MWTFMCPQADKNTVAATVTVLCVFVTSWPPVVWTYALIADNTTRKLSRSQSLLLLLALSVFVALLPLLL